jgi:hypothetical protein
LGGDRLDLSDLLPGFPDTFAEATAGGYLGFASADGGLDTIVRIDPSGGADSFLSVVRLDGVAFADAATTLDGNIVV